MLPGHRSVSFRSRPRRSNCKKLRQTWRSAASSDARWHSFTRFFGLQPNHIGSKVVFRFRENHVRRDDKPRAGRFPDDRHGAPLADRDLLGERVQPAVDQIRVAGAGPVKSDNLNKLVSEFVAGRVFDFVEVDAMTIHGSGSLQTF